MKGGSILFLGIEGKVLSPDERKTLRKVRPAGIVLVTRNIEGEHQLRALVADLRAAVPEAIFCLDAEGGRVDRLKNVVAPAPAAAALAHCPPTLSKRAGKLIGQALRHFDFDLDFAPVIDLDHGIAGNALDERTFGAQPRRVVARAKAMLEGLHQGGAGACVKHFPGLGRATADTHLSGAHVRATQAELERDRTPFNELFALAESAMVGHAIYPGWGETERPASLSRTISTDLLRKRSKFRGFLFSDDLEMGALAGFGALPELGVLALTAGCDGLLFCRKIDAAEEIASDLARRSLRPRLEEAERRWTRLRARLGALKRAAPAPLSLDDLRRRFERLATEVACRQPGSVAS